MAHFLLPSTPLYGHITPMVAIGRGLLARGHSVTLLTGRKYQRVVESLGMRFLALPPEVDYDDARLDQWLPGRDHYRGLAAARHDILGIFVRPLPAQHQALVEALAASCYDAVVCESAFLGAVPLLLTVPSADRVPIVGVSVTPLSVTSVDCAPFGSCLPPGDSAHTRRRNRFINAVLRSGPLRPIQTELDAALSAVGSPRAPGSYFDLATCFDETFQLAVPGLEYPRRELPSTVRFVGPLRSDDASVPRHPSWWHDLDGSRPVVHVTQGTMANADLGRLLVPTICALANSDVLVVAATGGRPISGLLDRFGGRLPDNVRAAEFLPYAELLRKTAVMVTNGGFGGVQQALTAGVPLVVAGDTEDKPEVAARVAWAGAGVNLWTGAPSPARLGRAVAKVLRDPRYRLAAQRLQREIATHGDPVPTIIDSLEQRISSAGPAVPASRPLSLASRRDSTDRSAASARRRKPQRRARRARRDAA